MTQEIFDALHAQYCEELRDVERRLLEFAELESRRAILRGEYSALRAELNALVKKYPEFS